MISHLFVAPGQDGARSVDAFARELSIRAADGWTLAAPVRTLHVGVAPEAPIGSRGTPAPPSALRTLLGSGSPSEEFAVEASARALTPRRAAEWIEAGVNRVSVRWPWDGALRTAAQALRAAGVARWGVDLAFGPGARGPEAGVAGLAPVLEARPDQVSLVETGTDGDDERGGSASANDDEKHASAADDETADAYLALSERLEEAGYPPWELTTFAREGGGSRHFAAVWRGEPYLGLGPGAGSFDGTRRIWNLSDADAYFSRIERGLDPLAGRETLDREARFLERAWSGLRLAEGLALTELPPEARALRGRWAARGWAHPDPARLRLTRSGWLLLDSLAIELTSIAHVEGRPPPRTTSEAP